jgi:hypothetical protein
MACGLLGDGADAAARVANCLRPFPATQRPAWHEGGSFAISMDMDMLNKHPLRQDEGRQACHRALDRYHQEAGYRWLGRATSMLVLAGQAMLLHASLQRPTGWAMGVVCVPLALFLADLVNGLVHLWMDHNSRYGGWTGPLVAAFHLHHARLRYEEKPLWRVYVHESGFKLWLPPVILIFLLMDKWFTLPAPLLRVVALSAILSSVAELSHFLCHNRDGRLLRRLGRMGLLLDKARHLRHHREDNVSYAFLNGWSDPLIDRLASWGFKGYKHGTDRHVEGWTPPR